MENTVVINGVTRKLTKRGKIVFGTIDILGTCALAGFFSYIILMGFFG